MSAYGRISKSYLSFWDSDTAQKRNAKQNEIEI